MAQVAQEIYDRHASPEKKHTLNVPCIGWIFSQAPKAVVEEGKEFDGRVEQELKAPILIWWIESVLPTNKKRKLYFSYLDERGAPMRANLSEAIKQKNEEYKRLGFNINCTNTYRYVYAVPKIPDRNFAGFSLWEKYDKIGYVPSYIADRERLIEQGLALPEEEEANVLFEEGENKGNEEKFSEAITGAALTGAKGKKDEQILYRNMVITACGPLKNPEIGEELSDPTCTTNAIDEKLADENLELAADSLLWKLDVFLQYVADNTFRNFQRAGYGNRVYQMAYRELRLVEYILFEEKNYRVISEDDANPVNIGALASQPVIRGNEGSRRAIEGLRLPTWKFPWTPSSAAPAAGPVR
jgi:hypothetical protein